MTLCLTIIAKTFTATCDVDAGGKVVRADNDVTYMTGWSSMQVRRFCDRQRPAWKVRYGQERRQLTDKRQGVRSTTHNAGPVFPSPGRHDG